MEKEFLENLGFKKYSDEFFQIDSGHLGVLVVDINLNNAVLYINGEAFAKFTGRENIMNRIKKILT